MIELLLWLAGVCGGVGLGFWLGFRKGLDSIVDDDNLIERNFLAGARAQQELGFLVKRVKEDGPLEVEKPTTRKNPKLRQDPRNTDKGNEYPGARPVPPMPTDFVPEGGPEDFVDRIKSVPRRG